MIDRNINEEDEISAQDIINIIRKRAKFIILFTALFFIGGILYGLFAPKEYESKSIISIGRIFNIQIQSNGELLHTLGLIPFSNFKEASQKVNLRYAFKIIDNNSIEILTSATSAHEAYETNLGIIDTILNRHNHIYNEILDPIDESIMNLEKQIVGFEKLIEVKSNLDRYLTSFSLLNSTKLNLNEQKQQLSQTRVIVQPRIMEGHIRPNLRQSIIYSILASIFFNFFFVFIKEILNKNNSSNNLGFD